MEKIRTIAILLCLCLPLAAGAILTGTLTVLFVLCVAALATQSYNPFIYFRF